MLLKISHPVSSRAIGGGPVPCERRQQAHASRSTSFSKMGAISKRETNINSTHLLQQQPLTHPPTHTQKRWNLCLHQSQTRPTLAWQNHSRLRFTHTCTTDAVTTTTPARFQSSNHETNIDSKSSATAVKVTFASSTAFLKAGSRLHQTDDRRLQLPGAGDTLHDPGPQQRQRGVKLFDTVHDAATEKSKNMQPLGIAGVG